MYNRITIQLLNYINTKHGGRQNSVLLIVGPALFARLITWDAYIWNNKWSKENSHVEKRHLPCTQIDARDFKQGQCIVCMLTSVVIQ